MNVIFVFQKQDIHTWQSIILNKFFFQIYVVLLALGTLKEYDLRDSRHILKFWSG